MVTQKKIKGLDLEHIGDYFLYINTSIIVGQKQQAIELFKDLSGKQKLMFYNWLGKGKETGLTLIEVLNVVNV